MPELLTPAALYLRVSTDQQSYSLETQRSVLERYAKEHDYVVVEAFVDKGRSGITTRGRPGLQRLLTSVLSGDADFEAILVQDVSRWGRFQDIDEAAHYEFLCRKAGIRVVYCADLAEHSNSILKNLRRVMAGEFSRALSTEVFTAHRHSVESGNRLGACPFGYRRVLLNPDGTLKRLLQDGEHKNTSFEKTSLVLGPGREIRIVREVFSLALGGRGMADIEKYAKAHGWCRKDGGPLLRNAIRHMLQNPVYTGRVVWNRKSRKLGGSTIRNPQELWVTCPRSVPSIVDKKTFKQVQRLLSTSHRPSDSDLISSLRRLYRVKRNLSFEIICNARKRGQAFDPSVYCRRFGSLRRAYELAGFTSTNSRAGSGELSAQSAHLRDAFMRQLVAVAPDHFSLTVVPGRIRHLLLVDARTQVSVRLCPRVKARTPIWRLNQAVQENRFPVLLVLLDKANRVPEMYFLLRQITFSKTQHFDTNTGWVLGGKALPDLNHLHEELKALI